MKMVNLYRGKKRTEVPPHLYAIADNAYASMLRGNHIFRIFFQIPNFLSLIKFSRSWKSINVDHVWYKINIFNKIILKMLKH